MNGKSGVFRIASMRAVGAAVAAPLRVDTLASTQIVSRTNFLNASGCLATQPVAGATCSSFHRVVKALDTGRQNSIGLRFRPGSFACRCSNSEDASNLPRESQGLRNEHSDGENQDDEAGPRQFGIYRLDTNRCRCVFLSHLLVQIVHFVLWPDNVRIRLTCEGQILVGYGL